MVKKKDKFEIFLVFLIHTLQWSADISVGLAFWVATQYWKYIVMSYIETFFKF